MKTAIIIALLSLLPLCGQTITPQSVTLAAGQSQQFTAPWPNAQWSTPFSAVGTLSATGLYTAPATITKAGMVIVVAKDPATGASASASVAMGFKAAAQASAAWVYQEIPTGGMDPTLAGTGFYLALKCTPVPGTVHLWLNGALLYETGKDQVGALAPAGSYYVLDKRLAGININVQAEGCATGPCPQMRVDYQYASCP